MDINQQSKFPSSEKKSRLLNASMNTMGKIPPQDVELEESILGSIIEDSNFMIDVADLLKPQHFYTDTNRLVYEAIYNLYNGKAPIDMMTVTAELRRTEKLDMVGGGYAITNLTSKGLKSGTQIDYHSKIIIQKYMQREMIRISSQTIADAYEDSADVFELIERNQNSVFLTLSDTHQKSGHDINELIEKSFDEMSKPPIDGLTGVGSGFYDLDALTGGWQKSDLVIVAARPAMGKTAFILKCARNAAVKYKKPTLVFSLEMSSLQLTNRLLSDEADIYLDKILKRQVSFDEIERMREKSNELKTSKLIIDDSASLNIFEFRAKCRRLKSKFDIGLIVVDYLQLMHGGEGKNSNRDNEIGMISRALKSVAKELDVPVLALSQLSRTVESRPGKRPMLSDLRESGNIEQDADQVLFLYRPEYYGIKSTENGANIQGLCEVIIAKNRHGVTDTVNLHFNGSKMRFKDWYNPKRKRDDVVQTELKISTVNYSDNIISSDEEPPF